MVNFLKSLAVYFFKTDKGTEPVREWLKSLSMKDRKIIGEDIKTVQFGWPLGMPLVRSLGHGLWEARSKLTGDKIERVIFFTSNNGLILMKTINPHLGQSFDDFLLEEDTLTEAETIAIKRVLAFEIKQAMQKKKALSKSAMAAYMHTSRSSLDRLLDPENTAVTLQTLIKAAQVIGKKLHISLQD